MHISNRGAGAAAVGDVGVDPAKPFDGVSIEVIDQGKARLSSGCKEGFANW